MAEFGGFGDWDLQAIVGSSYNISNNNDTNQQPCSLGVAQYEEADDAQGFLFSLNNNFGNSTMLVDGELEQLYKPFYPVSDTIEHSNYASTPKQSENDQEGQGKQGHVETPTGSPAVSPTSRKRKDQQQRLVNQVKAEDLSSDMWAWRKYGQKPIKGSPYPRSYYRCSSMKGCLARKQMEQSCTDPGVYIVTYTGDHCHSQPTRRNSLAGTVRQKFPTIKSPRACGSLTTSIERVQDTNWSENELMSSRTKRIVTDTIEEYMNLKQEKLSESEDQMIQGGYMNNESFVTDFLMNDDFFSTSGD